MSCKPLMSDCGETFVGRSFDSITVDYPRAMDYKNSSQMTVITEGKEFGGKLQIQVAVPLEAFDPHPLGAYMDMNLNIDGPISGDERKQTPAKLEFNCIGLRDVKDAVNEVSEVIMPLV